MHYFAIGGVFKNEGHILKEWIDHYTYHGVEHIYLINDFSTDNFLETLQPYIDKKIVTLYNNKISNKFPDRQGYLYNLYFNDILKNSKWFGILDLDEFLYSPLEIDLKNILKKYETYNLLHINWVHFGSSNFDNQPNNVVSNFVYRGDYNSIKNGPNGRYNSHKSIVKTDGDVKLSLHTHTFNGINFGKNVSFNEENTPLLINHYAVQSKEYWKKIKMTRGDCDFYYDQKKWERNMQLFKDMDINDIFDDRLKKQNEL